ncbi:MAG: tyrosine-type recombinase/integrase [Candidatus Nitrospinota bacterium M3_3B_026]
MALYKRGRVWWMSFSTEHGRIRRSTETADKKLAMKIFAKVTTGIAEGRWLDIASENPGSKKTFEEMMGKYLDEYAVFKTKDSRLREASASKSLLRFFKGRLVGEITSAMIVEYKSARRKLGRKPATIEREVSIMRRAYNLAVMEWEWVEKNPASRVSKIRFNNQVDRWLSFDEEKRLLAVCPERLRDIIVFALNTGMRQAEILDLRWPYVDLKRRTAVIMKSKNGERRSVPLNKNALGAVMSRRRFKGFMDGFIFCCGAGGRLDRTNLQRDFKKAVRKAGVEKFRFHDLRHTFATRLVRAGVDLYSVAKLLGHKDIRMTQRYAHHCIESLRPGVEILDGLDRPERDFVTILSQSGDFAGVEGAPCGVTR